MGYRMTKEKRGKGFIQEFSGCGGCLLAVLTVNLLIGGVCFDYVLKFVFDKDIPWYGDAICGLFLGELAIPATVICWVINLCGVSAPLVG